MLLILTGQIQIGKTRWLQQLIAQLETRGCTAYGVIAPGTWIEHRLPDGGIDYEKTGITNELLPQHEIVPFARRRDLLAPQDKQNNCTQSENAQLAWAIDDTAIKRVNDHLHTIAERVHDDVPCAVSAADKAAAEPSRADIDDAPALGLLVIDELGRLELLRDEGLTNAMALLDRGATATVPHALVVVREQLLDTALRRFANTNWGGIRSIAPCEEAQREIFDLFGL